jgi:hypothetical protein
MLDVSDEFDYFFWCYFRNRSDFNPLGEFIDGNQDMFVSTEGGTKWSYSIEAPHSAGPELAGATVWQRIGILCTSLRGL